MPEHVVPLPGLVGELLQAGRQRARELQFAVSVDDAHASGPSARA